MSASQLSVISSISSPVYAYDSCWDYGTKIIMACGPGAQGGLRQYSWDGTNLTYVGGLQETESSTQLTYQSLAINDSTPTIVFATVMGASGSSEVRAYSILNAAPYFTLLATANPTSVVGRSCVCWDDALGRLIWFGKILVTGNIYTAFRAYSFNGSAFTLAQWADVRINDTESCNVIRNYGSLYITGLTTGGITVGKVETWKISGSTIVKWGETAADDPAYASMVESVVWDGSGGLYTYGYGYLKKWGYVGTAGTIPFLDRIAVGGGTPTNSIGMAYTDNNRIVVGGDYVRSYGVNGSRLSLLATSTAGPSRTVTAFRGLPGDYIYQAYADGAYALQEQYISVAWLANKYSGPASLTVQFTDTSSATGTTITSWDWDFGDGSAHSTSQNPNHTYVRAGTFFPVLTISNGAGLTDTSPVSIGITSQLVAGFTSDNTLGQPPLAIQFTDTSTGQPVTWDWDFGDGSAHSTSQNPSHTYTVAELDYTVTLIASRGAATDTEVKVNYIHTDTVPVSITTQPVATQVVNIGYTVVWSVTATGTGPLSYQWYKNGGLISGATTASYTTPAAAPGDDGASYHCVVSNLAGPVQSDDGILNVIVLPVITSQPQDLTEHISELAIFQVIATSPTFATYKWYFDGVSVGDGSNIYTRVTLDSDSGKTVYCQIINDDGMTESRHAVLTAVPFIGITTQPRTQVVLEGSTATFTITATGVGLDYQWFLDGALIPGAIYPTYTTDVTSTDVDSGSIYYCVVSDLLSSMLSDFAWLEVYQMHTECGLGYGTSRYAINKYKVCKGIAYTKMHYYALKKIFPMPQLAGVLDDDLGIEGFHLDNCYYAAGGTSPADVSQAPKGLLAEFFADSAVQLLSSYERVYALPSVGSNSERRARIQAAIRAKGGLSIPYYTALATSLGYTITITEGATLQFNVGTTTPPATPLSAPLYSELSTWVWSVHVAGVSSAPELEALFNRLRPAHTRVTYTY